MDQEDALQTAAPAVPCPRCGYDLRGEIVRWATCCPLDGVCTECGCDVRWAEVVAADKFLPRWSVEYADGPVGIATGALRTALRSFRPRRFWTEMRMSQPVRGGRLLIYALILALAPLFMGWMVQGIGAVTLRARIAGSPGVTGVAYTYYEAVFDGMFRPFARTTSGTIMSVGGAGPYPPPSEFAWWSQWNFGSFVSIAAWCFAMQVALLMPTLFVLLPASRHRAKVRWAHVGRVAVTSLIIPSAAACLFFAAVVVWMITPSSRLIVSGTQWLMVVLPIPALIIWWAVAIRRYLRMPHGLAVSILLSLIALLLAPVAIVAYASFR